MTIIELIEYSIIFPVYMRIAQINPASICIYRYNMHTAVFAVTINVLIKYNVFSHALCF